MTADERMKAWDTLDELLSYSGRCSAYQEFEIRVDHAKWSEWTDDEVTDLVDSVMYNAHRANRILDLVEELTHE